ncbi:hypothetical protein GCM10009676_13340 [Prauserella halophila]|uniref:Uncharacterized protein n=1 Tax=Prauserella halophila TaxID=185641 RepID=A0ABP4GPV9_9PSEU
MATVIVDHGDERGDRVAEFSSQFGQGLSLQLVRGGQEDGSAVVNEHVQLLSVEEYDSKSELFEWQCRRIPCDVTQVLVHSNRAVGT